MVYGGAGVYAEGTTLSRQTRNSSRSPTAHRERTSSTETSSAPYTSPRPKKVGAAHLVSCPVSGRRGLWWRAPLWSSPTPDEGPSQQRPWAPGLKQQSLQPLPFTETHVRALHTCSGTANLYRRLPRRTGERTVNTCAGCLPPRAAASASRLLCLGSELRALPASSVNPPQPSPSVPPADSLRLDDPPDLTLRSCGSQPSQGPSCATCSLRTASAQWWRRASRSRLRGREIMPGDRNSRGRRAQETFPGLDQGLSER
nr:uncharacterized protein LOC116158147 [Camelus dromedarius]